MNWALFFQIEVIILTIGLVGLFLLSARQTMKDNSFNKRIVAAGTVLQEFGKMALEKSKNEGEKNDK